MFPQTLCQKGRALLMLHIGTCEWWLTFETDKFYRELFQLNKADKYSQTSKMSAVKSKKPILNACLWLCAGLFGALTGKCALFHSQV